MVYSPQEIEDIFVALGRRRSEPGALTASSFSFRGGYLATNEASDYLFLLADDFVGDSPSKRLKWLSVDYGLRYSAVVDGSSIAGTFNVLRLDARNSQLLGAFCTMISVLSSHLGVEPSAQEMRSLVATFIELFTPRMGDPRDRIKGLFGELCAIDNCPDKTLAVSSWHDSSNANRDFSFPEFYLEIKASEGRERKHKVSQSQLQQRAEERPIYLLSILLQEDPRGQNVFDLLDSIKGTVPDPALQRKLNNLVFESLGFDVDDASDMRFVVIGASSDMRVYRAKDLPSAEKPSGSIGGAISGISYTLNLDVVDAAGVGHTNLQALFAD